MRDEDKLVEPPPNADGMSFADVKRAYAQLYSQREEEKRLRRASDSVLRVRAEEARGAKKDLKKVNKQLVTISKKQKAKEEANKAGMWSGGAAVTVTIMYEMFKISGFPGGLKWMEFWEHEAVFGVIMWMVTLLFGHAYKAAHPDSK